jgi:hypothetical protein
MINGARKLELFDYFATMREVLMRGHGQERAKQEVLPAASMDGFTAIRDMATHEHRLSGKFIFFKNAL